MLNTNLLFQSKERNELFSKLTHFYFKFSFELILINFNYEKNEGEKCKMNVKR